VRLPGFDYTKRPADKLEIPLAERIASIRARKTEDRQRARINAERRAHHGTPHAARVGR
jgi:ATP-dependent RNA helicase RhlE